MRSGAYMEVPMKHLSWIAFIFSVVGCSSPPTMTGTGGTGGGFPGLDAGGVTLCSADAQCPAGDRCVLPVDFQCPPGALCKPAGICVPAPDAAGPPGQCVSNEGEH